MDPMPPRPVRRPSRALLVAVVTIGLVAAAAATATAATDSKTPPVAAQPAVDCAAHAGHHSAHLPAACLAPAAGAAVKPDAPAAGVNAYPTKSFSDPPPQAQYREFAANCTESHILSDDPIVYPNRPGASHSHTFIANRTTNAASTNQSLLGDATTCQDAKDSSAYWFPTLYRNSDIMRPQMATMYYKSGVKDYRTVLPFPAGFRLLVGDMNTPNAGAFKGYWTCGGNRYSDFPRSCPDGSSLIVRLKAPSCWDGVNLDTPDHKSHMAYPVNGVCTASHPVPLPMLELKVPYKLPGGITTGLRYSSGASYSFHYDFMNAWDPARQKYLVEYCVNGGRQCNGYGVDPQKP
jgi:hypothetical protein